MAEADLSKIINLIMENPALIEQIKSMVGSAENTEQKSSESDIQSEKISTPTAENTYQVAQSSRRNDLLRAIRPYLSEGRGKAIESMITIADIISVTKKET